MNVPTLLYYTYVKSTELGKIGDECLESFVTLYLPFEVNTESQNWVE